MRRVIALLVLCLVVVAVPVFAQTTPIVTGTVSVGASPDHNTVDGFGTVILTRYEARVTVDGSPTIVLTKDLGKPTPSSGTITVVVPELLKLPTNVAHRMVIAAVGPGGEGVTPLSAPFGVQGPPAPPTAPPAAPVVQ